MWLKMTNNNYSPNFSLPKRKKNKIKFIIIHYTGMKTETGAIKRLCNPVAKVSSHYFIKKNGEILNLIPDLYEAWHAGKSKWKRFTNLNKNSIGIELVNKGHNFGYERFPNNQIKSLKLLCKQIKKKYKIRACNFLGHSDIAPLRKNDPGEKFPWEKLSNFKIGNWFRLKKSNFPEIDTSNKQKSNRLFFKNLFKIGYRYFNVNKRADKDVLIIKAFQRRYLPNRISGKIDKKTLKISLILAKKSNFT